MSKEEVLARGKSRQAKGQPPQTQSQEEKMDKVEQQLAKLKEELEYLRSKQHLTTGHVREYAHRVFRGREWNWGR